MRRLTPRRPRADGTAHRDAPPDVAPGKIAAAAFVMSPEMPIPDRGGSGTRPGLGYPGPAAARSDRTGTEQPLDAAPRAVEHGAVAQHRVGGMAHQQLGVELVDELLWIDVGRQLPGLLRLHGGGGEPRHPFGRERQDLLL